MFVLPEVSETPTFNERERISSIMASKRVIKQVGRYSDAKRLAVASEWASSGNVSQVSRITGVSRPTIIKWRDSGDQWWIDTVDKARHQIGEEILATQLTNARLAGEQLQDRIQNGDTKVLANGSMVTVPMTGKDLAVVNGIQVDKARTAMNMPTRITSQGDSIQALAQQFRKLAGTHTIVPKSTIIEHEKGPTRTDGAGQISETE
jgi:hypothetical protein